MKIKFVTLLLLFFTYFISINAYAYTSYGARGCGNFVSSVDSTSEKDKIAKNYTEALVKAWIAGYVTSFNMWLDVENKQDNSDIVARTDIDGVYMSVLNYCRANPLQNINNATDDTIKQLLPQPKAKTKR
ncbi:hypothetical protein G6731_01060 [Polynucleobacter paneuropaeus]|uniref:Rap1a immunity protein domain-containing protein n=1 Tax=Polynucleobacter paneuropaeus TaxID=2527775 RepID=A0A9Q2ZU63_9BURK|nr:hypothetical protein [Polynucleobacter paneuropaeus]